MKRKVFVVLLLFTLVVSVAPSGILAGGDYEHKISSYVIVQAHETYHENL